MLEVGGIKGKAQDVVADLINERKTEDADFINEQKTEGVDYGVWETKEDGDFSTEQKVEVVNSTVVQKVRDESKQKGT